MSERRSCMTCLYAGLGLFEPPCDMCEDLSGWQPAQRAVALEREAARLKAELEEAYRQTKSVGKLWADAAGECADLRTENERLQRVETAAQAVWRWAAIGQPYQPEIGLRARLPWDETMALGRALAEAERSEAE